MSFEKDDIVFCGSNLGSHIWEVKKPLMELLSFNSPPYPPPQIDSIILPVCVITAVILFVHIMFMCLYPLSTTTVGAYRCDQRDLNCVIVSIHTSLQ